MFELDAEKSRPADPVGRVLYNLSRLLALFGGIVLSAMTAMTTISVTSRYIIGTPIPGDFELIAAGTGIAIFAFLPYCQIIRENVIVDFFLSVAPLRVKSSFDFLGSLMYGLMMVLVTWRMVIGGMDLKNNEETSMILEFPFWMLFPSAIACLALLTAVCFYTVANDMTDFFHNRARPKGGGHGD